MKLTIIFLLSFLVTVESFAFERPKHCDSYDDIYASKADSSRSRNDDYVYSPCYYNDNLILSTKVNDLISSFSEINDSYLKTKDTAFRDKLTHYALQNLAERSSLFVGLAGSKSSPMEKKLESCLEQIKEGESERLNNKINQNFLENKSNTKEFMSSSFDKAIYIQTLFSVLEKMHLPLKKYKKRYSRKKMRSKEVKERIKELEQRYKKFENHVNKELQRISITDPFLLTTKNDFHPLNWYNGNIAPSSLSKTLTGKLPRIIQEQLTNSLFEDTKHLQYEEKENPIILNAQNFQKSYGEDLEEDVRKYKNNYLSNNEKLVMGKVKEVTNTFADETKRTMLKICDNKGKDIHYHNKLIDSLMEMIIKEPRLSDEQKKEELIGLGAWQCYRWRENPYEKNKGFGWKEALGWTGFGVGGVLTLTSPFTGVGAIVGPGLMAGGGALLTWDSVDDFVHNNKNIKEEEFAYYMGWRDIMKLRKSYDKRLGIGTNLAVDILSIGIGPSNKLFTKSASKMIKNMHIKTKVAENIAARTSGATPSINVENYIKKIFERHNRVRPSSKAKDFTVSKTKGLRGNRTLANFYLKNDEDFLPMLKIISDPNPELAGKSEAFSDLYSMIRTYKSYPERIRETVRNGINLEEIVKANEKYKKVLKRKHFQTPGGKLPEVKPPLKLGWSKNGTITLEYQQSVWKDGKEVTVSHREDFLNYQNFRKFVEDSKGGFDKAFSFSAVDELARKSDVFNALDEQAELYSKLDMVRNFLVDSGKNVDSITGKYPNLSNQQNGALFQLNEILKKEELFPRRDSYDALLNKEIRAEIGSLVTLKNLGSKTGKYGDQTQKLVTEGIPSTARRLAPLGLVGLTGIGGTGVALNSFFEKFGARGQIEDFNEAMRELNRSKNEFFYRDAPIRFTDQEEKCAKSLRAWSIENDCLLNIIVNQLMVKERIRDQYEPDYDMISDPELGRKVRVYINDFYRLREYFASGKAASLAQQQMREEAKTTADIKLRQYLEKKVVPNGLEILDKEGVIPKSQGDKLRDALLSYRDNPDEASKAYQVILKAFAKYEGQVIQNPEITPELKDSINKIRLTEEVLLRYSE